MDIRGTGRLNNIIKYDYSYRALEEEPFWKSSETHPLSTAYHLLLSEWVQKHDVHNREFAGALSKNAYNRQTIIRLGQSFSVRSASIPDSHVIYRRSPEQDWVAASIADIFSHSRSRSDNSKKTQTFAVVNNYRSLTDSTGKEDPHCRYPHAGGKMFYNDLDPTCILLSLDEIECHFVALTLDDDDSSAELLLTLPLHKVSHDFFCRRRYTKTNSFSELKL